MQQADNNDSTMLVLQNQFRGLISRIRNARYAAGKAEPAAQTYTSGLKDILQLAKVKIPVAMYDDFLAWLDLQESALLGDIRNARKGYENLSGVAASKPVDLNTELQWISAVLALKSKELSNFRSLVDFIEKSIFYGELGEAIESLAEVDKWGVSLWSVQLRIAITHEKLGLEAQKKLASEIQEVHKRGLLGFVAYYCSVRNESRTSAVRYTQNTNQKIDAHRYFSGAVKRYLRHILVGDMPISPSGLSDLLRTAQSHHFIDSYEEFVAVSQKIACSPELERYWPTVLQCLDKLGDVRDFRLKKIRERICREVAISQESGCPGRILNEALEGRPSAGLREFTNSMKKREQPDAWELIYVGWIVSEGAMKPEKEKRIYRRCIRFIAAMHSSTELFDPYDALIKISRNFGQLPIFVALKCYAEAVNNVNFLPEAYLHRIDLNSRSIEVGAHQAAAETHNDGQQPQGRPHQESSTKFWLCYLGRKLPLEEQTPYYNLATTFGALRMEESEEARRTLNNLSSANLSGAMLSFYNIAQLQLATVSFNRGKVIEIISHACSESKFSPIRHRIEPILTPYGWPDYAGSDDPILSAVAIHMLWAQDRSSKTASVLRYALRHCLKIFGVGKPSEINLLRLETSSASVVYFFKHVCVPEIIDVSKAIRGSRQVLEERAAICQILVTIDRANAWKHYDEISEIQQQLTLADGQLIVDSSRIFVETAQLKQWANRNLSEEYSRYRDLAALSIGNFKALDEVLAGIVNSPMQGHLQYVPESEADILLLNILSRVKDEFLTNASFGLDFFLSKRIRHQSFIGSIRGPLEFSELITSRVDLLGEYKPNYVWVNKLAVNSSAHRLDLLRAFDAFAQRFDGALLDAKDRYFQIRTKETPNGLISLALTANIVELVKSMVPMDTTFDDFLNTVEALLWIGLEPALAVTRSYISEELKGNLAAAMEELRTTVKSLIDSSNEFLAFDAEVGKRSNEVQVKLDEISGWFKRTNLDFADKSFDLLEAIEMAQKFALSCLPGFNPQLEISPVEADIKIKAESLVFLHDLVLIALQNSKDHSGLKSPKVCTACTVNMLEGSLRVRIESEVKPTLRESARRGADEKARMILEGKSAFRSRREGGSGFFKLAAITNQSSKGKLDFGISESGQFFLDVQYSLLISSQEADA